MSRIALTSRDMAMKSARRRYVPILSVLASSAVVLLPIIMSNPIIPDVSFMVLIAWRLLRPEMWTPTSALPLGLFNDLMAGHPLGQSMALWTMTFLLLDFIDSRAMFRDYWMDWLLAAVLILFHSFGEWLVGKAMGSHISFGVLWPQIGISVLAYPFIARLVVTLDRWRLSR